MGGGNAPTARHTSDNQDYDQLSNIPALPAPSPTPTVDNMYCTTYQVVHAQEEAEDQNDAFDLIKSNNYNTKSDYYLSLSFTQSYILVDDIHTSAKYSTAAK